MKSIIALSLMLGTSAFADQVTKDILTCSFTEPFYSIEFDANTGVVTAISPPAKAEKGEPVREVIGSASTLVSSDEKKTGMLDSEYTIVDAKRGELLRLVLNLEGSDGMSDLIYPFSVWHGQNMGGCSTETVKVIDTQLAIQKLMPTLLPPKQ